MEAAMMETGRRACWVTLQIQNLGSPLPWWIPPFITWNLLSHCLSWGWLNLFDPELSDLLGCHSDSLFFVVVFPRAERGGAYWAQLCPSEHPVPEVYGQSGGLPVLVFICLRPTSWLQTSGNIWRTISGNCSGKVWFLSLLGRSAGNIRGKMI